MNQEKFYGDEREYDPDLALKHRITEIAKASDKVTYTINFTLTKINNNWTVDTLKMNNLKKPLNLRT